MLVKRLNNDFALKDIGLHHCFLDIRVNHTSTGFLLLKQYKYVNILLIKDGMVDSKPSTTPMSSTIQLSSTIYSASYDNPSH